VGTAATAHWPEAAGGGGGVWAVVDGSDDGLGEAAAELLALARGLGTPVTAVVLAAKAPPGLAENALAQGADRVLTALSVHLASPTGEAGAEALESLLDRAGTGAPAVILAGATRLGRGVLARLAARRGLGLTGDCVGAERGADGRIRWLKPAFGGNVVAPILCRTRPELATLVQGSLRPLARRERSGPVEVVVLDLAPPRVRVEGHDRSARAAALALDRAEIVLCLGNTGLTGEDVARVADAADAIGQALGAPAAVAATRRVADAGILPRQVQVGMTGRAVAPRLYVGLGVRGAAYHLVGIRHARTVLAVNQDPAAPIFAACDIGIVGDWRTLLPALEAALAAP
jgi:electron transfer flavoprotein alpha subunit